MGSKIQMQDWSYLKKYQKENAKLPSIEHGQKRIVFMGHSITEFWSDKHSFFLNINPISIEV